MRFLDSTEYKNDNACKEENIPRKRQRSTPWKQGLIPDSDLLTI